MTQSKSEKSGKSGQCSVDIETDDDLLDPGPTAEVESDADLMKALDSDFVAASTAPRCAAPCAGPATPTPAPLDADWLADFKAVARKHRPFSTTQMVQILRALNAVDDPTLEARQ